MLLSMKYHHVAETIVFAILTIAAIRTVFDIELSSKND